MRCSEREDGETAHPGAPAEEAQTDVAAAAAAATLAELGADWLWATDAQDRFTVLSDGFCAATGLDPARVLGRPRREVMAGAAADRDSRRALADDTPRPFRDLLLRIERPDGTRLLSVSGTPCRDEAGRFAGYRGTGRNVTALAARLAASPRPAEADAARPLMAALEVMQDAFCFYDEHDRVVLYNRAMVEMYGELEDVLRPGLSFEVLLDIGLARGIWDTGPLDAAAWRAAILAKRRQECEAEAVIAFRNGRRVLHREKSTAGGTIVVCTDVTELERAKENSEAVLSDLKTTLDTMRMAVVVVDRDLRAVYANRVFYEMWSLDEARFPLGSHYRLLMEINRRAGIYDIPDEAWGDHVMARLAEIGGGSVAPREFLRADGRTVIYSVTALSGGKRLVSFFDITDMKTREAALAAALEKSKLAEAVIDSLPNPIFVKDANLEFVLANKAFAGLFGTSPQAMLGRKGADFVGSEHAATFEASERSVLETGADYTVEEDFEYAGLGQARVVRKHRVSTGRDTGYVACSIFDVSELKRRERDAEEARRRLEEVIESLPAGVVIYDRDDRFVLANRKVHDSLPAMVEAMQPGRPLRDAIAAAHRAGYFRETGDAALDALYDADPAAWIEAYCRRYRARHAAHERQNPDGRWFQVYDTRTEDGTFIGVRVDITELKDRESALRESMRENEVFRNLIDNVPVAIYAKRPDLKLMYVNEGWCRLTGRSKQEAIGKNDIDIFGEQGRAFMEGDLAVLRTRQTQEIEETMTDSAGGERHQIARKAAMVASDGSFYLIGSTTDITEQRRREDELRVARRKAEAADRAKSEFLANMSHEIRTPMNGVLGMAELLAKSELTAKQRTFTNIIVKSGNALLTIINDILDFSKIDAGQLVLDPVPFNLAEAVEDVAALLSMRAQEKDLELILRVDPDLPACLEGDVGRIRQIITNLVGNAIKFTERGHVLVDVTGRPAEGGIALHVRVADTGIGIPADKRELIFDKFSQVDASSTRRHEGTGLGLAISSRLVALMGGQMGVESQEGCGSTFWFEVALPESQREESRVPVCDVSGARVLVVDDNAVNRAILMEQMTAWGFDACAAESGAEGLLVLKAAAGLGMPVDCVVLDYQMPGMSGGEAARAIRATPEIAETPIVMLTSVDQSLESGGRETCADARLVKPARSAALLETLVETIQRCRGSLAPAAEGEGQTAPAAAPPGDHGAPVPATRAPAAPLRSPPDGGHRVDVLVAEDNEVNQLVFTQILGEAGIAFEIVGNGRLALQAYRTARPRLVLMDVSMPEMNGLEAAAAIRRAEAGSDLRVPIIGVTAHALKGDRERCLEAGMDDYLSKPISPRALLEKLERWGGIAPAERQPRHASGGPAPA
ncbi:PAS-domain containing protein [Aquibium sp. A9E412]|uniref:PAS domain S-box protein n=1 Tax=Aquibium sp. A9E412 TaxID=2976767 RepID=UPI0025AFCFBE|nr:PAS-domain containing protein [Aquibium sp. A9E412]MDN2565367.1 PAS-domain containing protein [Aquibium sp. A9E412]